MDATLLSCVCTYSGHRGAVRAVDYAAPDSHRGMLISGDSDGKIHLWDPSIAKKAPYSIAKPLATFDDGGNVRVLRWCPPVQGYSGPPRFASACEKLASKPAAI